MCNLRLGWQRIDIHGETVVLTGDQHLAAIHILHRVIGAVVAKFHLDGSSADCQSQQLVAHADAKNGHSFLE